MAKTFSDINKETTCPGMIYALADHYYRLENDNGFEITIENNNNYSEPSSSSTTYNNDSEEDYDDYTYDYEKVPFIKIPKNFKGNLTINIYYNDK